MTTQADVLAGLAAAQQVTVLAGTLATSMLPPGSKAAGYVTFASSLLGIVAQAIEEQTTEGLPTLPELDVEEVVILAADAKAQADADLRLGGG